MNEHIFSIYLFENIELVEMIVVLARRAAINFPSAKFAIPFVRSALNCTVYIARMRRSREKLHILWQFSDASINSIRCLLRDEEKLKSN